MRKYARIIALLIPAIWSLCLYLQQEPAPATYSSAERVSAQPVVLYANQDGDDLRQLYLDAINGAQRSIRLIIYALTDPQLISALRTQSQKGVDVRVVADALASPQLDQKLGSKISTLRRFGPGLMHQKLLAVDDEQLLVGSANLTSESLRMHANLVAAVSSEALAKMVSIKADSYKIEGRATAYPKELFDVGGQALEFWFLPDNKQALARLKELLSAAQKTVQVAMFTWTSRELAQAAIQAALRGVKVDLVIDQKSAKGASAKIVKLFKQKGINVSVSQGGPLLHHKFLLIDGETLVNGSANWTRAAFSQNDDCFFVLHPLNGQQQAKMQNLWKQIKRESVSVHK
jgi:cardiolipin synthase A/B